MSNKTLLSRRPLGLTSTFSDLFEPWGEWFSDGVLGKSLTLPRVNISEDKNNFTLDVAAPGLHKSDFKIDVNGNILTISAQREENKEDKDEKYTRKEYNYSSFSRSFTLPEGVQQEKIEATYDGGVLKLSLPKNEKTAEKNHKAITVK